MHIYKSYNNKTFLSYWKKGNEAKYENPKHNKNGTRFHTFDLLAPSYGESPVDKIEEHRYDDIKFKKIMYIYFIVCILLQLCMKQLNCKLFLLLGNEKQSGWILVTVQGESRGEKHWIVSLKKTYLLSGKHKVVSQNKTQELYSICINS
jgi:hypothetical protein